MNPILRALWDRLLPPGGDVAVAVPADDREGFMPGGRPLRNCWLRYQPKPRQLGDNPPGPDDLDPHGRCWWRDGSNSWVLEFLVPEKSPRAIWLPYWAITHPNTEP